MISGPSNEGIVTRAIHRKAKKYQENDFSIIMNLFQNELVNKPDFPEEQKDDFLLIFSRFRAEINCKWPAAKRTKQENFEKSLKKAYILSCSILFVDLIDRCKRCKIRIGISWIDATARLGVLKWSKKKKIHNKIFGSK